MRALRWALSPFLWPVFLAWRWFTPNVDIDPRIGRLAWLRTGTAALTFLILAVLFGADRQELTTTGLKAISGGIFMFAVAFFGGLAYLNQFDDLRAGWRALRPAAWRFLSCYLVAPLVLPLTWLARYAETRPVPTWVIYLARVPETWFTMLALTALLLIARDFFNASDINPLFPPIVTPVLSFWGMLISIGEPSRVPDYVSVPIAVIGTVASSVLARIEFGMVKRFYGCTVLQPPQIASDPATGRKRWVLVGQSGAGFTQLTGHSQQPPSRRNDVEPRP